MSIPFYVPDDDVYTERQLMLGGPTGVPVTRSPGQVTPGLPQRWVAVDVLTRSTVDAGIRQPEPNRLVLCACINKYGCICYGYHDEIDVWSRWTLIFAVVFSILTTPLALLCFLPALKYMKRADQAVKNDMVVTAREHCNVWRGYFSCGIIWVTTFLFAAILTIIVVGVTLGVTS